MYVYCRKSIKLQKGDSVLKATCKPITRNTHCYFGNFPDFSLCVCIYIYKWFGGGQTFHIVLLLTLSHIILYHESFSCQQIHFSDIEYLILLCKALIYLKNLLLLEICVYLFKNFPIISNTVGTILNYFLWIGSKDCTC